MIACGTNSCPVSLYTLGPVRLITNGIVGAGFVRVPYPRKYDMPPSKNLEGDDEHSEIYSMSITHQLHCLVSDHLNIVSRSFC